jgi:8-oxo-dGTP pyrophosphatase MutT (NUDIX family)
MSDFAPSVEITPIDQITISVEPWSWGFSDRRRQQIDDHFKRRQSEQPALWNGRALLLRQYTVRDGVLQGTCFETDYASLLAWRDWEFPDREVYNLFAAAALQSADGAYLVGEMAPHTASAGQWYFPCGTPEPSDVDASGKLDLVSNLRRELQEETGLDMDEVEVQPGWTLVRDRGFLAFMRGLAAHDDAERLQAKIRHYIDNEQHPEFRDVRFVRRVDELNDRIPHLFRAFLHNLLSC